MRLENDSSRQPHSPTRSFSNGSGARSPRTSRTANGNSHAKSESNGSSAMRTNGSAMSNGRQLSDAFFGHSREEVTRILIQGLTDLGYHGAADVLVQESGYELEGPTVAEFRRAVVAGEWAKAEVLLFGSNGDDGGEGPDVFETIAALSKKQGKSVRIHQPVRGLTLAEGANKDEMKFWMRQQKYLELLESRDLGGALLVLRRELTPLHQDVGTLHALSSLMMCKSAEDLKLQAQWDGAAGESRHLLLSSLSKAISPSVMIPEHRLAVLLDDVKSGWISNCLYHNTSVSPSLYIDHTCDSNDFPRSAVLELRNHTDEVWYLKYSHDGTKLATASKDNTIIIYETNTYKPITTMNDHDGGVCFLAWSPDDTKLISCGQATDNSARVWDVSTGIALMELSDFTYPVTTAAWSPDGESFVTGSQDVDQALIVWDLAHNKVMHWKEEGLRVHDLAISPDGRRLVVLIEKRIFVYDYVSRQKLADWSIEDVKLTSVAITQDSKHMLVSMNDNKIRLMDIETGKVMKTFTGHTQTEYIIRSSFGGANEGFVVSGSEDSRIFIWRTTGHLVETLDAHRGGCVNAVSWHPKNPKVFASAGDDHRVRIWSLDNKDVQRSTSNSNGFSR